MVCVYCGSETKVNNSRWQKRNNQVWRRRECLRCKTVFTTHEKADLGDLLIVMTSQGISKPFSEDILFTELLFALQDRKDSYNAAREVVATVTQDLLRTAPIPQFPAYLISASAATVLKRLDRRAWLRFVAEHPSLQA